MKKDIKSKMGIFPMPVLLISTYNEDGSVDVMNAAWGMMQDYDKVAVNLAREHKTTDNIFRNKAFVIHFANAKYVAEADYFGLVSGADAKDKFARSKLHASKAKYVNAPIIDELPLAIECEFIEFQEDATGCGVIAKVVNVSANDDVLVDGKIDIDKVEAISYDPFTHGYYKVSGRVADAFKVGNKLK